MTLVEFIYLNRELAGAISKMKEALISAESPDELELFTSRLNKVCDAMSKAKCADASRHEVIESVNLVAKGRRLVFTARMASKGEEFPRLRMETTA
jgi:hypothetical protein